MYATEHHLPHETAYGFCDVITQHHGGRIHGMPEYLFLHKLVNSNFFHRESLQKKTYNLLTYTNPKLILIFYNVNIFTKIKMWNCKIKIGLKRE